MGFDGKIFAGTNAAVTMTSMFEGASSFTGKNAQNMVTNTVVNMQSMFQSATVFNAAIPKSTTKWDVALVTSFVNMFNGASSFNQNIATWDLKTSTDNAGLAAMFSGASNFQQNLCRWNIIVTEAANNVPNMFSTPKCPNANSVFTAETTADAATAKACCTCGGAETVPADYPACA